MSLFGLALASFCFVAFLGSAFAYVRTGDPSHLALATIMAVCVFVNIDSVRRLARLGL